MDTTWEDLLEKGARFVPNEDYMRPDGTHKFFDRMCYPRREICSRY